MHRARLVKEDVAAGIESEEVALFDWPDIPWNQIAFPTAVWALAHFHDFHNSKADLATCSNPTSDLAKMWPPREPARSLTARCSGDYVSVRSVHLRGRRSHAILRC